MVKLRTIRQWANNVARAFKPEKIILFGSYAYGKPSKDSDIDLLVVMRHRGPAVKAASRIRLALPSDVPVDVIVRSPERLEKRLKMNDFFIREIVEKGQVLYAAADA